MIIITHKKVSWKRCLLALLPVFALVAIMVLPIDSSAQKAKKLNVKSQKVKRVKPRGTSSQGRGTPAMLLNGGKQIGLRGVYLPNGYGGEVDFGYLFKEKFIVEGVGGFHYETLSDVDIIRIPVHAGLKYRLIHFSTVFGVYSGVGLNFVFQSMNNIKTSEDISTMVWGPSIFGEGVWNVSQNLAIVLRGEQVFAPSEKFTNSEGDQESLKMLNLSLGLRKTF